MLKDGRAYTLRGRRNWAVDMASQLGISIRG